MMSPTPRPPPPLRMRCAAGAAAPPRVAVAGKQSLACPEGRLALQPLASDHHGAQAQRHGARANAASDQHVREAAAAAAAAARSSAAARQIHHVGAALWAPQIGRASLPGMHVERALPRGTA